MLVDANMPSFFWPLAAQAAVHTKNHLPHSALPSDTTPFEQWFKKKSDLSHLCPFGALVTAQKTNSDELNKVVERGEEGQFVGYARDAKGYLIWFPHSKTVRTHRDIRFHGFPTSLPAPPLSEILWDDIPRDLEPRFQDSSEQIAIQPERMGSSGPSCNDDGTTMNEHLSGVNELDNNSSNGSSRDIPMKVDDPPPAPRCST
jgi:hypothetical protein